MNLDAARDFVRRHHRGVLATARADGTPQMSPVLVGVDDEGMLVVSTRERAMKTRNLRRDPRASVCVLSDEYYGGWVQVDGRASVVSLPAAMDGLIGYYRQISGEHPDWDEYRADMEREHRVLVRIEPERAGPDRAG
jgi:PPOX class probable F420-dependent enzyme